MRGREQDSGETERKSVLETECYEREREREREREMASAIKWTVRKKHVVRM